MNKEYTCCELDNGPHIRLFKPKTIAWILNLGRMRRRNDKAILLGLFYAPFVYVRVSR